MTDLVSQGLALQAASIGQTYKVPCRACGTTGYATRQLLDGSEESGGICRRCDGLGFVELDYRSTSPAQASSCGRTPLPAAPAITTRAAAGRQIIKETEL